MIIVATIILYFALLTVYSRIISRHAENASFFRANGQSRWYMVAFGMIGASVSGVSFVSVPGMVCTIGMTYMQTCLGFIAGYIVVAFVLLPVYYRLNLTSIYGVLRRNGRQASLTGACFFILSELSGAAVKFFVVCAILQRFVLEKIGVPFAVTVVLLVLPIWLYTRRGGIKTLVRTDGIQTACMLVALCVIIYKAAGALDMNLSEAVRSVCADSRARWFVFDDAFSTQYFWKQFLSGAFIVDCDDGFEPECDAEKSDVQDARRGAKRHVQLRRGVRAGQPAFPLAGRAAGDALREGRRACSAGR